jgi:hypothetical protein
MHKYEPLSPRATPNSEGVTRGGAAPTEIKSSDFIEDGADRAAGPAESDLRGNPEGISNDGSGRTKNVALELVLTFCKAYASIVLCKQQKQKCSRAL